MLLPTTNLMPAPAYLRAPVPAMVAPAYLDGSLAGDIGFDPLCLTALARRGPDSILDGTLSTEDRQAQMLKMPAEEQRLSVAWMREAEVKHGRLAMLAAAGWPLAELLNSGSLYTSGGRAPSLFNGGLFDGPLGPFLFLATGGERS